MNIYTSDKFVEIYNATWRTTYDATRSVNSDILYSVSVATHNIDFLAAITATEDAIYILLYDL